MVDWLEQFLSLMPTQNELFKINTVPVSSYWLMLFEDFNIFYSSCWKWPPWPSVPQQTKKDCSKGKNYGTGTNLLSKLGTKFRTGSGSKYNVSLIPNSWIPAIYFFFLTISVVEPVQLWPAPAPGRDRLRLREKKFATQI